MASTTLVLKDPNSDSTTRVICLLRDGRSIRIKIYSDYSIKPKHWSSHNKNVLSANTNAVSINNSLKEFKNKVLNIYEEAKGRGIKVDAEYIKDKLKPTEEPRKKTTVFWTIWQLYLDSNRSKFKSNSLLKLESLSNHLKEFETFANKKLEIDNISGETLDKLQSYFYEKANLSTGTAAKYIGIFKMVLNWAKKYKYTDNSDHKQFSAIQQPDTLKVIFTKEDIVKIKAVQLKGKEYLANVRELLLLSTLTGLRYSDFSTITSEHLKQDDGGYILQKRQEKTNDYVEIPLTPEALKIVRKILEGTVHPISNQKMNKYVKDLCEIAGLDDLAEVHTFKGKIKTTDTVPKYKLITTHTGRRTFATNLLLRNVPAETVMEFTGHRDYKSFAKYVNIPKKEKMKSVRAALMK